MFTGLVMDVGTLESLVRSDDGARICITTALDVVTLGAGASVAVNGVCLTVRDPRAGAFEADLSLETLRRTTFESLTIGAPLNLEPALCLGDPMGGHLVQGHVDGLAELVTIECFGAFRELTWRLQPEQLPEVVEKGSITLDGISLTIAKLVEDTVTCAIVPHTDAHTNLGSRTVGDPVNIETDVIGKYVRRTLTLGRQTFPSPVGE
jgi:riboflavin synthase